MLKRRKNPSPQFLVLLVAHHEFCPPNHCTFACTAALYSAIVQPKRPDFVEPVCKCPIASGSCWPRPVNVDANPDFVSTTNSIRLAALDWPFLL